MIVEFKLTLETIQSQPCMAEVSSFYVKFG